jgi:hypothetical protein
MWSPGAPSFYVAANRLHDGERRLDDIRARKSATQLRRHPQTMHRERFFHGFLQAASNTGIQLHQLAMQSFRRTLGIAIL